MSSCGESGAERERQHCPEAEAAIVFYDYLMWGNGLDSLADSEPNMAKQEFGPNRPAAGMIAWDLDYLDQEGFILVFNFC